MFFTHTCSPVSLHLCISFKCVFAVTQKVHILTVFQSNPEITVSHFTFFTSVCWLVFLFPLTCHIHLCLSFSNIFCIFSSHSSSTCDIILSSPGPYYPLLDYLFSFTSAIRFIYTFVLLLFQLSQKMFKWTNLDTFDIIFQITVSLLLLWSKLRYQVFFPACFPFVFSVWKSSPWSSTSSSVACCPSSRQSLDPHARKRDGKDQNPNSLEPAVSLPLASSRANPTVAKDNHM